MIVDFTFSNIGPFKEPATLTFEASADEHLASAYVREFEFSNGKSIRLLRMAMLYGANAAGKSTVLEALSLLDELVTSPEKDSEVEIDVNSFAFQVNASEQPSSLMVKFVRLGQIYRYQIEFTKNGILSETLEYQATPPNGTKFKPIYHRVRGDERDTFTVQFGDAHELNQAETDKLYAELLPNVTVLSILNRKMAIKDDYIKQAYAWFKKQLMSEITTQTNLMAWVTRQLDLNKLNKNTVIATLNQAGIPIKDIEVVTSELSVIQKDLIKNAPDDESKTRLNEIFSGRKSAQTVYQINGENYTLSLEHQESLGTTRYYGLAGVLSLLCQNQDDEQQVRKCKILPIDEIEHSLHPDLLEQFIVLFLNDSSDSQLIATSHYREFLQNELLFRNDVIWFVDKDETTLSSDLYCLIDVKADAGLRATSSVYNFYKQGRLGAVPKLNN